MKLLLRYAVGYLTNAYFKYIYIYIFFSLSLSLSIYLSIYLYIYLSKWNYLVHSNLIVIGVIPASQYHRLLDR